MRVTLLDIAFDPFDWPGLRAELHRRLRERIPTQLTVVNANAVVMAGRDPAFAAAVRASHLVLCDSAPLQWFSRLRGRALPARLAGPDVCAVLCELAAEEGWRCFFLGATPEVLKRMTDRIRARYPGIAVAGTFAPPMRAVFSAEENAAMIAAINAARPDILWVGLTAPKQELWLHHHLPQLHCTIAAAVGAAFDFFAGTKHRAPRWLQRAGLEWFFRLCQEPRRLARRYLVNNARFCRLALREMFRAPH
ncbi:MAG: WecB/TagA/CpsF family glycosyltransferase [Deltaproteobacteria bacterium]|nr:WecB/TagA/CpsF family glycosyltransferase [Deltaproteobacteria bacterium]